MKKNNKRRHKRLCKIKQKKVEPVLNDKKLLNENQCFKFKMPEELTQDQDSEFH